MKAYKPILVVTSLLLMACQASHRERYDWVKKSLDVATVQLEAAGNELKGTGLFPRSVHHVCDTALMSRQLERDPSVFKDSIESESTPEQEGQTLLCPATDWTSGFFPGSLWYAYELTGKPEMKELAVYYTNLLDTVRHITNTHDVGFMAYCSYGNALRLTGTDTIPAVLKETADNLCGRFNDTIGCIRSWDFGAWNYPVIIDNMMNLDLLFNVYKQSLNNRYRQVAIRHALTTMKNHFRPDFTCYHVVSYKNDGSVECKRTHQGKHDESAWARGQAWAAYGYTSCFEQTKDSLFLQHATGIANMIMQRVKTADLIPLWDYDAIDSPETPRDASAAAITASAFIRLSELSKQNKYFDYAEKILKSLSGDAYLAKPGTNNHFILMHSTGSLPNGFEIDAPLNYADYYFLEALQRYMKVKGLTYHKL